MRLEDEQHRTSFNSLQIEKALEEQKQRELNEQRRREQIKRQEQREYEREEFRNNSLSLFQIDILLLLTIVYSLIMGIISIFTLNIGLAVSCLIGVICTLFIGKSSYPKYQDPQLTNTVLWNLSQSIFDFIDIKIPFEVLNNKDRLIDISTVLGCIVFLLLKSTSIFYLLVLVMFIIAIIVSFSMKDVETIYDRTKIISIVLFAGLIFKTLLYSIIGGSLYIDVMNILLLNIFTIIKIYSEDLEIQHV